MKHVCAEGSRPGSPYALCMENLCTPLMPWRDANPSRGTCSRGEKVKDEEKVKDKENGREIEVEKDKERIKVIMVEERGGREGDR